MYQRYELYWYVVCTVDRLSLETLYGRSTGSIQSQRYGRVESAGEVKKTNAAVRASHQYRTEKRKSNEKKSDTDFVRRAFKKSSATWKSRVGRQVNISFP